MADVKINLVKTGFGETAAAIEGINKKLNRMVGLAERSQVALNKLNINKKAGGGAAREKQEKRTTYVADREARKRERIATRESNKLIREAKRVAKDREKRNKAFVGKMAGGAKAGVIGAGVAAGAAATGFLMSEGKRAVNLQDKFTDLKIAGRKPGESGVSEGEIGKNVFAAAKEYGLAAEDITAGLAKIVAGTGDMGFAMSSADVIGKVSRATGADLEDLGDVASALYTQMDVKSPEALMEALSTLSAQAKLGAVELKDLAAVLPKAAAAAKVFGLKGSDGISMAGGLMQMSKGQFKSPEEAATAVDNMFRGLDKNEKLIKSKYGVDMKDESIPFADRMAKLMTSTGGDANAMMQLFGDVGYKAVVPMSAKAKEMKKSGASKAEIEAEMLKIIKSFTDTTDAVLEMERDAAEKKASAEARWNAKMAEVREKMTKIDFTPIVDALVTLAPILVEFAKVVADLADFFDRISGKADQRKKEKLEAMEKKQKAEIEKEKEKLIEQFPTLTGMTAEEIAASPLSGDILKPLLDAMNNTDAADYRKEIEEVLARLAEKDKPPEIGIPGSRGGGVGPGVGSGHGIKEFDLGPTNKKINSEGGLLANVIGAITVKLTKKMAEFAGGTTE